MRRHHFLPAVCPHYVAALLLLVAPLGCTSDEAATRSDPPAEKDAAARTSGADAEGPPPGIGKKDDAAVLGPFETDAGLTIQGYKSSEANGTVNSWLLMGETDAALIDAQLVLSEGEKVAEMITATGKTLKWIWVTHGHPDHSTGLAKIVAAFPDAKVNEQIVHHGRIFNPVFAGQLP